MRNAIATSDAISAVVAKIGIWVGMRLMSNHVADWQIAPRHFSSPSRPTPPSSPAVNHDFVSTASNIAPVAASRAIAAVRARVSTDGWVTAAAGGYDGAGFGWKYAGGCGRWWGG